MLTKSIPYYIIRIWNNKIIFFILKLTDIILLEKLIKFTPTKEVDNG